MLNSLLLQLLGQSAILSHGRPHHLIIGLGREIAINLQVSRKNGNRSRTVPLDIQKTLRGGANELFQSSRIGSQKPFFDEYAALQLHKILFGKSDDLAKSILFSPEGKRRRKHSSVNDAALEPAVNRRHDAQTEDQHVAASLQPISSQCLPQERIGAAADAAYADFLSLLLPDAAARRVFDEAEPWA